MYVHSMHVHMYVSMCMSQHQSVHSLQPYRPAQQSFEETLAAPDGHCPPSMQTRHIKFNMNSMEFF